jgi:hypothetical protein
LKPILAVVVEGADVHAVGPLDVGLQLAWRPCCMYERMLEKAIDNALKLNRNGITTWSGYEYDILK